MNDFVITYTSKACGIIKRIQYTLDAVASDQSNSNCRFVTAWKTELDVLVKSTTVMQIFYLEEAKFVFTRHRGTGEATEPD